MVSTRTRARQTLADATAQRDRARQRLAALCRGEEPDANPVVQRAMADNAYGPLSIQPGGAYSTGGWLTGSYTVPSVATTIQTIWNREITYQLAPSITVNAGDTVWFRLYTNQETALSWEEPWTWSGFAGGTQAQPWGSSTGNSITNPYTPPVEDPEAVRRRQQDVIERYIRNGQLPPAPYAALMTEQQRNVAEGNRRQREIEAAERRERRARADIRAYALLDMLLTEQQRTQLRDTRYVTVISPAGNTYRLAQGVRSGNVDCWDPERRQWSANLCVHVSGQYPDGDNLAAQILAIQTDEHDFLLTANASGVLPLGMQVVRGGRTRGVPELGRPLAA